ncbi:MAG: 23S rRNA (guanosine-2'-O-)-methyltransferase RlmB [Betaproteobacteria bacterium ADurb.Bin341]|nr:MAG: 23S rRNA (guanosine-2'-O-)-methyltransferase RlmB [Betaproteobacteria bacterium ADurb.Bin341]
MSKHGQNNPPTASCKEIRSRDNPLFKGLKRLCQSARERQNTGKTLLDGAHLIRACEEASGPVEQLIVNESASQQPEIAALIAGRAATVLAENLFRDIACVETPSGIMAVVPIPASQAPDLAVDTVLLDGVQDPGNVGTLLRTAAAAGFRQVLLSADCAGVWSPKVLRAGQGAHFALSIVEDADLAAFLKAYPGTAAVTQLQDAVSLFDAPLQGPMAWVFGSEGQGVRPEVAAAAKLKIKIPMPGVAESLNVSAAAAVCLFETVRRRQLNSAAG